MLLLKIPLAMILSELAYTCIAVYPILLNIVYFIKLLSIILNVKITFSSIQTNIYYYYIICYI